MSIGFCVEYDELGGGIWMRRVTAATTGPIARKWYHDICADPATEIRNVTIRQVDTAQPHYEI